MSATFSAELDVAREAARTGGEVVARSFGREVAVRAKAADEVKTCNLISDADVESEHAVVEVIRRAFPRHAILGEEAHAGRADAERLWVIDPLDGTNNFAHDIGHFAVSVAYYEGGRPACSVIYNPIRQDWFVAARGQGAFHNDVPAKVAAETRLDEVLVGVGFYYDRGAMMEATLAAIRDLFRRHIHGIRRFGTASLDLCHVGLGRFGAFFEYELSPWDFAGGRLFVEEAGGRVTTCRGEPLPLHKTSVLATNGPLHEEMLQVVSAHHPPPS